VPMLRQHEEQGRRAQVPLKLLQQLEISCTV
jgi:hypothetical protein